ncbi:hypothetical protein MUK42_15009, partial [Musa troglodytarum]
MTQSNMSDNSGKEQMEIVGYLIGLYLCSLHIIKTGLGFKCGFDKNVSDNSSAASISYNVLALSRCDHLTGPWPYYVYL